MPASVSDRQVRKVMAELSDHGNLTRAAMKADMDRKTARKYRDSGLMPSEVAAPGRVWRTRADPFEQDWAWLAVMLEDAPELEAKALFEYLLRRRPERYHQGQVRTFQRHIKRWRATDGPDKDIVLVQSHVPGEALQIDVTWADELGVTIGGLQFDHRLCVTTLPYSNWTWATVCLSESLMAFREGLQTAWFQLGRVAKWVQSDNSSAATHDLGSGKREFNKPWLDVVGHFGSKPRTIAVGTPQQNGDVEAANGALKRRLKQHLLLRGGSDFESVETYEKWLAWVLVEANKLRQPRLHQELQAMKPLAASRLASFDEVDVGVSERGTIAVKRNIYSVPSRLRGERVRVRVYERRLEVRYGGVLQVELPRALGEGRHRIDYRHVIWSLVRKPGAFARYRYRAAMFPTTTFRRAHEALLEAMTPRRADMEYLRALHLAASTMESEVEAALDLLLDAAQVPTIERVRELCGDRRQVTVPQMRVPEVDLSVYDELLNAAKGVAR